MPTLVTRNEFLDAYRAELRAVAMENARLDADAHPDVVSVAVARALLDTNCVVEAARRAKRALGMNT